MLLVDKERERLGEILGMHLCEKCGAVSWEKLPSVASIPKSGRYSFEDK